MASLNFTASAVEPMQPRTYGPLPAGAYTMMVTKSDVKSTKAGTGSYLEMEMQVIDGEHTGRRHWERLNIDNPNKQAEDIAKAALAALCSALGIDQVGQSEELHDTPFIAHVEIDRKEPDRNRIVGYSSAVSAPAPAAPRPAPAAASAAAPAAGGARPWKR